MDGDDSRGVEEREIQRLSERRRFVCAYSGEGRRREICNSIQSRVDEQEHISHSIVHEEDAMRADAQGDKEQTELLKLNKKYSKRPNEEEFLNRCLVVNFI